MVSSLCGDLAPPSACVGQWLPIMFQRLTVKNVSESHTGTLTAMAHHHKPPPEGGCPGTWHGHDGPGTGEGVLHGQLCRPQIYPALYIPDDSWWGGTDILS